MKTAHRVKGKPQERKNKHQINLGRKKTNVYAGKKKQLSNSYPATVTRKAGESSRRSGESMESTFGHILAFLRPITDCPEEFIS
jgi:hypothetical protein